MENIKIDDKEYDLKSFSDVAKAQLMHLQAAELEIHRLNMQIAIFQTAKTSYINALKQELEKPQQSRDQ